MVRKKRQRFGGSKKKNFTEGWAEFKDKRIAKAVAKSLNNTQIGGQKHSRYYDDLWSIKYLSKFRWTHLTEKLGSSICIFMLSVVLSSIAFSGCNRYVCLSLCWSLHYSYISAFSV